MFPSTGILDTFVRANEGPPPSVDWSVDSIDTPDACPLKVLNNACASDNVATGGWWGVETFGPDCEGYVTWTTNTTQTSGPGCSIYLRLQTPGSSTVDGYEVRFTRLDSSTGVKLELYRIDNQTMTKVGSEILDSSGLMQAGDKLGAAIYGNNVYGFRKRVGNNEWRMIGNGSIYDATYTSAGYIGLRHNDFFAGLTLNDFGGGTTVFSFPTTSTLDDFNRADEAPLATASSGKVWTSEDFSDSGANLQVISNLAAGRYATSNSQWLMTETYGPDCEVFADIPVAPTTNMAVALRITPGGTGTQNGYLAMANKDAGVLQIYKLTDGSTTGIVNNVTCDWANGDSIGFTAVGPLLSVLRKRSGVWRPVVTDFYDTTYTSAGYIGLQISDLTGRIDNFGGGTIVSFPTTSILDNFNRADEGPPPSASWLADDPVFSGGCTLKVVSNKCVENSNNADINRGGVWGTQFGPNTEAFVTLATPPADARQCALWIRTKDIGEIGSEDGYRAKFTTVDANPGFDCYFERIDNNSATQLGATISDTGGVLAGGVKAGVEIVGSVMTAYFNRSGSWTIVGTYSGDTSYADAGYICLTTKSTNAQYDDFGGGTIGAAGGQTYIETGAGIIG